MTAGEFRLLMAAHVGIEKPWSAAVICFMPDYGHAQPLLKIADVLADAGFDIKCYLADECSPLMNRFKFDFAFFENTSLSEQKKILAKITARGLFSFNYTAQYYLTYPNIIGVAGRSAQRLKRLLSEQRPDVIICDDFLIGELFVRIAACLEVPLITNSLDGSLVYNQRNFVRTFGVTTASATLQHLVEIALAVSRKCGSIYYRLRYFRSWLKARANKRAAKVAFESAFPVAVGASATVERIVVGTAAIERDRLGGLIRTVGADLREFSPINFRSRLPVPEELREWLERDHERPIVYVSFGSAAELDVPFATAVYEGLRNVPARVLWSLPTNHQLLLSQLPAAKNIRLESFVPQAEILEIPAVRCFITQAGPHSVQEALFGGTPMLCIPFIVGQGYNSSIVEHLGVGRRFWQREVSPESISAAVKDILTNATYLENAREIRDDFIRKEGGAAIFQYITEVVRSFRRNHAAAGKCIAL
jgi:UDP-N-acetylglucosamine:LPS N-acetylglucosamine transferase